MNEMSFILKCGALTCGAEAQGNKKRKSESDFRKTFALAPFVKAKHRDTCKYIGVRAGAL